ncbi:Fis family transcriptional regulator [Pontibacillus chungwhensis BH030062]|uniref:Fis family transcriptional regulator n=1 Tax=Pontibacillus chungwhensis BH030062 TaxID=1385513 RepID=A0A0A2UWB1_9BACI|nr:sigma 54-interacting transcriptional regulator [Pontibacillus chungwhensis]KGP91043.1 Fis family transcriptional regulator [Pontibacillus chungwhensis BH030062]
MRKQELVLLAGTTETQNTLQGQLNDILGEFITIHSYASEDWLPGILTDQLVIYSSAIIDEEVQHVVGQGCKVIVARRTTNYEYIDQLFELPKGERVLYVNDFPQTAEESIETLQKIGIQHIHYVPYYPGKTLTPEQQTIKTAITPGEMHLIPDSVTQKINIGVRLIDITTLMEILEHFNLKEALGGEISDRYTRKIIELSHHLSLVNQQTTLLNQHLKHVVDGVNDGVVAFDSRGKITVFNQVAEQYTGVPSVHAIGKHIQYIFKQDSLLSFIFQNDETSRYFTINGMNLMVYRFHLNEEDTTVIIFKNTDETISMQKAARHDLLQKGYIAKYTFDDIIGNSPIVLKTKQIANRLAQTELPVLIQGESGTGKELYANAIHNVSSRKYQPFLAVNFSALPEDLLESELFGYEEGAFTGAKKGGKRGLFEQADGGTIFLDEIGDVSVKMQARLLRVIQELEIRRIGGNKNIPIDVRIVAATNKDLLKLIEQGAFREDLYHRLKVLTLSLPPLRERTGDIPKLAATFIREQTHEEIHISSPVMNQLKMNPWNGNIRELKNTISYMLAVRESNELKSDDLPNPVSYQPETTQATTEDIVEKQEQVELLQVIYDLNQHQGRASRSKITQRTPLSEQQVRLRLHKLQEKGYIQVGKGRSGTAITDAGVSFLQSQSL